MLNAAAAGGKAKTRTSAVPIGTIRVAQNNYQYTKVGEGNWRLTHHIIAEKKYGRKIREGERVCFKDKDRTNLNPDNIVIETPKTRKSAATRLARLYARRQELDAEISDLEAQQKKSL